MPPLDVKVHLQDDGEACGRACAQMVLNFLTGNLTAGQGTLLADPALQLADWATNPNELRDILNDRLPANRAFAIRQGTFDAAMGYARGAIASGKPAIAMTMQGHHWVVVRGFTPVPNRPGEFTVHFWDPVPVLRTIPVHGPNDICFNKNFAHSGADEVGFWDHWKDLFTAAPGGNPWSNKFVVLVPASVQRLAQATQKAKKAAMVQRPSEPFAPTLVVATAQRGLAEAGLTEWAGTIREADASAAKVVRVDRVGAEGSYFLVSLPAPNDQGILVGVDATTGEVLFARLNPAQKSLAQLFTPLDDLKALVPPGASLTGRLVWAPTDATDFSPYLPLAEVQGPSQEKLYLGMHDRRLISSLTMRPGEPRR